VTEVFDSRLPPRHIKQSPNPVGDYFIVTRMLDRSDDLSVSSYKIAALYGLDASTLRARFNRKLEDIEGQLGKYCSGYNNLAYYPQSASRACYIILLVLKCQSRSGGRSRGSFSDLFLSPQIP
jgi:hypothetical protein